MKIIDRKSENFPTSLLQIQNPPKQIYVEGDISLLQKDSIAIVGTRKCTDYGKKYTQKFAKELAKENICVVSGLASGIDTIAHAYSMAEIGKTIAVIGSGFDNIYPKENIYLYHQILENGGCIVSEYPPEEPVNKAYFPKRNRMISGLAMGVLVIEGRYRSGSMITARYAINQNKPLFCIPNKINEPAGYIPNLLIQNGAYLVTNPQDILEFYGLLEQNNEKEIPKKYQDIYQTIGDIPISINEISKLTGKQLSEISEALLNMELEGLIQNLPGNKYIRL